MYKKIKKYQKSIRLKPPIARKIFLLTLTVLLILSNSTTVKANDEKTYDVGFVLLAIRNDPVDPFFEVRLDEEYNIYLPLSKVLEYLELYLFEINWRGNFITGLIPYDNSYYYFDLKTGQTKQNEEITNLKKDYYFIEGEEIYILYSALGEWLPLKAEWDEFEFQISLYPDFKLVSEILEERQEKRDQFFMRQQQVVRDVHKERPSFFSPGIFSYSTSGKSGLEGSTFSDVNVNYAGNTLFGNLTGSLKISPKGSVQLDNFQLRYNDVLFFSNVTVGSTFVQFSPLIRETNSVQGLSYEYQDDEYKFGVTSLSGYVPEGSEVELLANGMLEDFQKADEGIYNFSNIDIRGSQSEYEIVIYLPDGRIERKKVNILSRDQLLSPGKLTYSGGIGKKADHLFFSSQGYYGLGEKLTAGAMVEYYDEGVGEAKKYMGGELLYRVLPFIFTSLNTQVDLGGQGLGYAWEVQSGFKNLDFNSEFVGYRGIDPPNREVKSIAGKRVGIKNKKSFQLVKNGSRQKISMQYIASNFAKNYIHQLELNYTYRLSLQSDLKVKNVFMYGFEHAWKNFLSADYSYSGWSWMNLKISTSARYSSVGLQDSTIAVKLTKKENSQNRFKYNWSVNLTKDRLDLSVGAKYKIFDGMLLQGSLSDRSWDLSLNISEMRHLNWPFKKVKNGSLSTAWIEGSVFLDFNGNGQMDEGEKPLSDVYLLLDDRRKGKTDQNGNYMIEGVSASKPVSVGIDQTTLGALYIPTDEKLWFELQPATGKHLDLGVVPCSGLSGSLIGEEELLREISGNVTIVLQNEDGEEKYQTSSECDGFFLFEKVLPGKYTLTVKFSDDLQGYELKPKQRNVVIAGGEFPEWLDGLNFEIK